MAIIMHPLSEFQCIQTNKYGMLWTGIPKRRYKTHSLVRCEHGIKEPGFVMSKAKRKYVVSLAKPDKFKQTQFTQVFKLPSLQRSGKAGVYLRFHSMVSGIPMYYQPHPSLNCFLIDKIINNETNLFLVAVGGILPKTWFRCVSFPIIIFTISPPQYLPYLHHFSHHISTISITISPQYLSQYLLPYLHHISLHFSNISLTISPPFL